MRTELRTKMNAFQINKYWIKTNQMRSRIKNSYKLI